jgi:hypothetical protein
VLSIVCGSVASITVECFAKLVPFEDKSTAVFFERFDKKEYNRTLRVACTSTSDRAISILSILIQHHDVVNLNPYESAGSLPKNAFDLARERDNTRGYELLNGYFSDANKVSGVSSEYGMYQSQSSM